MTDAREELRLRIRDEHPPLAAAAVIRGGPDSLALLQAHARRLNRLYKLDDAPVFGVSVFVVRDDLGPASERSILAAKLRSYPTVYRTTVGRLVAHGFDVLPTFTVPHFTVLIQSLDAVAELAAAFGKRLINPYADGRGERL